MIENYDIIDAALSSDKSPLGKLIFKNTPNDIVLHSDSFESFDVEVSGGANGEFTVGSAVAGQLNMSVKSDKLPSVLQDVAVEPYFGYKINGVEQWIPYGTYYINDFETEQKGIYTSLHAYDKLLSKVMDEPIDYSGALSEFDSSQLSNLGYQSTVEGMLSLLRDYNVNDRSIWESLLESYHDIYGEEQIDLCTIFDSSLTVRDTVSRLAMELGCNVCTSSSGGKVRFITRQFPTNEVTIKTSNYKNNGFKLVAKDKVMIGGYAVELSGEEGGGDSTVYEPQSIADGASRFSFSDKALHIITNGINTVQENLLALWGRLARNYSDTEVGGSSAIMYQPFELDCTGVPFITPLDVIKCEKYATGSFPNPTVTTETIMPIVVKHTYNGAISTKLSAATMGESSMSISSTTSSSKADLINASTNGAVAFYKYLIANEFTASKIVSDLGEFKDLTVNGRLSAANLDAEYARIDLANITTAYVDDLLAKNAIINAFTAQDGTITRRLDAVEINADMIKTGNLVADCLMVTGEDGLIYKLNLTNLTSDAFDALDSEQLGEIKNKIHGDNIVARSITADKITVSDLVAFGATIGGFSITDNELKSTIGSTFEQPAGIYFSNEGRFSMGNENGGIYLDTNNNTFDMDVRTVKAKEDLFLGHYWWDVRGDGASQRLTLKWSDEA